MLSIRLKSVDLIIIKKNGYSWHLIYFPFAPYPVHHLFLFIAVAYIKPQIYKCIFFFQPQRLNHRNQSKCQPCHELLKLDACTLRRSSRVYWSHLLPGGWSQAVHFKFSFPPACTATQNAKKNSQGMRPFEDDAPHPAFCWRERAMFALVANPWSTWSGAVHHKKGWICHAGSASAFALLPFTSSVAEPKGEMWACGTE